MTITKMYQIIMMFFLTTKRSLAQLANSQQPTANSQQPTANSQQPTANSQQVIFTVINLYFVIYILRTRAVSEFEVFFHFILRLLFFYAFLAVRLRSLTGRQKEILKQVQDDRSHTDSKSLRDFFEVKK